MTARFRRGRPERVGARFEKWIPLLTSVTFITRTVTKVSMPKALISLNAFQARSKKWMKMDTFGHQ